MEKEYCSVCNTHNVIKEIYDETENSYSYLCLRCGYTSNDHYIDGDPVYEKHSSSMSVLIRNLIHKDDTNKIWIPSIIMSQTGMLYPFGTELDWEWWFVPVVKITNEEKNENKYDSKFDTRVAIELTKKFERFDFISALKEFGDLSVTDNIEE